VADAPGYARVSIPEGQWLGGNCLVSVRLGVDAGPERQQSAYGERLYEFEIHAAQLADHDLLRSLRGSHVCVRASAGLAELTHDTAALMSQAECVFVLPPEGQVARAANILASLGFRVHLDASAPVVDCSALMAATDYYLFNPVLRTPVQPFHALLEHIAQGRGYTLWDTESESPATDFYLSEDGHVSLARRWHSAARLYGCVGDSWDALVDSPPRRRLLLFRRHLFLEQSPCVFCADLDVCGGYLRALDPIADCSPWRQVFSRLRDEAEQARDLLAREPGSSTAPCPPMDPRRPGTSRDGGEA